MKIMIRGLNMELTPAIKSYVEEKFGSIEEIIDPMRAGLAELRAEVGKTTQHHRKGEVFYAEGNLKIGSDLFRASDQSEELYAAINIVKNDLIRQLRKQKTKHEPSRETVR